ncbi:metallophosphoesterase [Leifsonia aquatica]|uniref:metallophosphoesterase n=1 Tax=Leifsonia aquatica TaxID=144185 RepID=UPI00046985BE|nr:metallophosphoesterase [Leifsonia aquatica]
MHDPRAIDLLNNQEFLDDLRGDAPQAALALKWDVAQATISKYRNRLRAQEAEAAEAADDQPVRDVFGQDEKGNLTYEVVYNRILPLSWWLDKLRKDGHDPEQFTYSFGHSVWNQHTKNQVTKTLYANRFSATRKPEATAGPAWQPIDRGPALKVKAPKPRSTALGGQWKTAVLAADTQIGFRRLDDGSLEPFHDEAAIDIFLQIVAAERPAQTVVMGDIIDLASQSRWAQEAGFALTTQPAIDRTTLLAAELRSATPGKVVWIEGNHDKRMQNFVETNAVSAFGLRKGNMPESWPVMSLPNLLRLDEFDVIYKDAYPTSHWWVNDQLRCEHGTKVRSSGSTAEKYTNETPHFSRAFGHTHRLEAQSKTTYDRLGPIRSVAINPGCLCRVDGAVPSVNGAIGADGRSAEVFENWQQGVAVIRFKESGEFHFELPQIIDGFTIHQGQQFRASAEFLD